MLGAVFQINNYLYYTSSGYGLYLDVSGNHPQYLNSTKERNMSRYEQDNLQTQKRCDQMMRKIEKQDRNVLSSVVPGSRLHQIIHNPITEGIDEG